MSAMVSPPRLADAQSGLDVAGMIVRRSADELAWGAVTRNDAGNLAVETIPNSRLEGISAELAEARAVAEAALRLIGDAEERINQAIKARDMKPATEGEQA